jgi:hypothetical protein
VLNVGIFGIESTITAHPPKITYELIGAKRIKFYGASRCAASMVKAGLQTAMYSAPSASGVL